MDFGLIGGSSDFTFDELASPYRLTSRMKFVVLTILILVVGLPVFAQKKGESLPELSAAEIIAKHVASVGTPAAIAAVKSRVMVGTGVFTAKNQPGKVGGPAQLASSGDKFLLAMVLNANNYPNEKFAYDGKELTTGVLPGGNLTPLGIFLKGNKIILRRGLLGGVYSQSWPLLHSESGVKLESSGTETIGGRTLYKLKAIGSGLGDMTVSFFFEPDTFHHVRTEYFYRTGQLASPDRVGGFAPNTYTLIEEFSNFTKVDDLVLPMTYQIEYTTDAGRTLNWAIRFSQVFNDQPLEASAFRVS